MCLIIMSVSVYTTICTHRHLYNMNLLLFSYNHCNVASLLCMRARIVICEVNYYSIYNDSSVNYYRHISSPLPRFASTVHRHSVCTFYEDEQCVCIKYNIITVYYYYYLISTGCVCSDEQFDIVFVKLP